MSTKKDITRIARITKEHDKKLDKKLKKKGITFSQWLRLTIEGMRS